MARSKKTNPIDLINELQVNGQQVPEWLKSVAAQSEALQQPTVDPVAALAGTVGVGGVAAQPVDAFINGMVDQYSIGRAIPAIAQAPAAVQRLLGVRQGRGLTQPMREQGPPTQEFYRAEPSAGTAMLPSTQPPDTWYDSDRNSANLQRSAPTADLDIGTKKGFEKALKALAKKDPKYGEYLKNMQKEGKLQTYWGEEPTGHTLSTDAQGWGRFMTQNMGKVPPGVHEGKDYMTYGSPEGKALAMMEAYTGGEVAPSGEAFYGGLPHIAAMAANPDTGVAGKKAAMQLLNRVLNKQPVYLTDDESPFTLNVLKGLFKKLPPLEE